MRSTLQAMNDEIEGYEDEYDNLCTYFDRCERLIETAPADMPPAEQAELLARYDALLASIRRVHRLAREALDAREQWLEDCS